MTGLGHAGLAEAFQSFDSLCSHQEYSCVTILNLNALNVRMNSVESRRSRALFSPAKPLVKRYVHNEDSNFSYGVDEIDVIVYKKAPVNDKRGFLRQGRETKGKYHTEEMVRYLKSPPAGHSMILGTRRLS